MCDTNKIEEIEAQGPTTKPNLSFRTPISLAGRGERLGSILLDLVFPIIILAISGIGFRRDAAFTFLFLCSLVYAVVQIYLLSKNGQTLGKMVTRIRIVRDSDGGNAGFVHAVLLRAFIPALIFSIPGFGPILGILDVLCIFGKERRCMHDLFAGTKVITTSKEY